jgi:hypothetical protein
MRGIGKRGAVSILIQVLVVAAVCILVLIFLLYRISVPSLKSYGNGQAHILAESVASSIGALSTMEEGSVEKSFGLEWTFSIYSEDNEYYVRLKHESFEGRANIPVPVDDINLFDVGGVAINKKPDGTISVSELTVSVGDGIPSPALS